MAEQSPYGDILNIIGSLASPALQEFGRIYGVMDDLENLKRTLESIKVVLSDAEQRQDKDAAIEHWIRRLKEVLYDADNLLDDLEIKDLRRKVNDHSKVMSKVRDFFSSENPLAFRSKLARKIEKIQKQFSDVAEDISKLKLNSSLVILKQNENAWRETGSFVLQSDIIGREENKNEIIDLLMQTNTNDNVSLIAIVGIGGLGKTALAQLVYNDSQVQELFDKRIWVCVSEDFEVKTVLKKMLKSLKKDEVGDLEVDILQKKLHEELNGPRYMLVLDDVWNESQLKWNVLRTHLMHGGQGSKILVTTRSTMVSKAMGIDTPYVLEGLTKEQSWTLLKNLTFGEDTSGMNPNLESIGEKIAEKCCGVPLAIRTIGGFLHTINEGGDQWLSILNGDVWSLCEEKQSMMPVLKLSYQNLPLELRQCFAYCCLYPKDWIIKKDELIQSWMAQGYLASPIKTQSMEEVGNNYVKILLMRSFFQDVSLSKYNDIISFKMHDLMHDLAKSVAGNDCYLHSEGKQIVGRPMHLSFLSSTMCSLDSSDVSKLRTLLCRKTQVGYFTTPSIITNLKYLRVLNLSYSSITKLPESIDKCKHLRSLNLSNCKDLISLPKSIGNLVGLQSLNLGGCEELMFSTEIVTKLISLRHLEIEECKAFEDMPVGLGQLTSLQSLSSFKVGYAEKRNCGKLNELKELNNLTGHLRIRNLNSVKDVASESQEANLKAKEYIQILNLEWEGYNQNSDISLQLLDNLCPHQNLRELNVNGYPGVRFSSWLPSLTNIVHIFLRGFPNCQYLPPLERLPWLKSVHIFDFDELEYIHYEEISHVFFPSLEELILLNCEKLRGWKRLPNDIDNHHLLPPFPRISNLHILSCPNLTCMPPYPHVVHLTLNSCSVNSMIETCLVQLHSSSFNPHSGLKRLEFFRMEIEAMPEEWMKSLTSLEYFSIGGIPNNAPLFQQLQHLPAELRVLEILFVDKLDVWKGEDDISTQCQVPHGLRSLQKILIAYCDNLNALPERICDLQSLKEIWIHNCYNLESLPEGMCRLTNLQTLSISGCPLLLERCQIETGEDWPKIAHIRNITVR
ncbi:putative disease resistance protein RGA1 [Gastrolobium bilobum]|uniref:putative disease resistance protein RGA1 n=1 Tax=Gastrolobium bilobum TaxID=150636 RepID=UPI002AAFC5F6|nr:putative disease resistance protein RGA1 [Gastrolobium bilobum]